MNRKNYRKLAKKYGVGIGEMKKEMQKAIKAAYIQPTSAIVQMFPAESVPTVDEFICEIAKKVRSPGRPPFVDGRWKIK